LTPPLGDAAGWELGGLVDFGAGASSANDDDGRDVSAVFAFHAFGLAPGMCQLLLRSSQVR